MSHRKITQIVGAQSPTSGAEVVQLYALCNDGTLWSLELDRVFGKQSWKQVDTSEVETAATGSR